MTAHTQNDRLEYLPYAHSVELLTVGILIVITA